MLRRNCLANATLKQGILLSSLPIFGFLVGWVAFPRIKTIEKTIPTIITKHDTVSESPKWLEDSIKIWKKKIYTSDTIPIYHTITVIDTNWVQVLDSSDIKSRVRIGRAVVPDAYPVLEYHSAGEFGDTGTVTTFNIRNGSAAASKFFTAGVLTDIEWDTVPIPRLSFKPFPPREKHNWLYAPKLLGIGILGGLGTCGVIRAISH